MPKTRDKTHEVSVTWEPINGHIGDRVIRVSNFLTRSASDAARAIVKREKSRRSIGVIRAVIGGRRKKFAHMKVHRHARRIIKTSNALFRADKTPRGSHKRLVPLADYEVF